VLPLRVGTPPAGDDVAEEPAFRLDLDLLVLPGTGGIEAGGMLGDQAHAPV